MSPQGTRFPVSKESTPNAPGTLSPKCYSLKTVHSVVGTRGLVMPPLYFQGCFRIFILKSFSKNPPLLPRPSRTAPPARPRPGVCAAHDPESSSSLRPPRHSGPQQVVEEQGSPSPGPEALSRGRGRGRGPAAKQSLFPMRPPGQALRPLLVPQLPCLPPHGGLCRHVQGSLGCNFSVRLRGRGFYPSGSSSLVTSKHSVFRLFPFKSPKPHLLALNSCFCFPKLPCALAPPPSPTGLSTAAEPLP